MTTTPHSRKSGHATGMAGEFFVMEQLFRLGHQPALTLGNTKHIDILVQTKTGTILTVNVKAVRGKGKWPVGKEGLAGEPNLVFVFLLYEDFENPALPPNAWIMSAKDVETRKRPWIGGSSAVFYHEPNYRPKDLDTFKAPDGWKIFGTQSGKEIV